MGQLHQKDSLKSVFVEKSKELPTLEANLLKRFLADFRFVLLSPSLIQHIKPEVLFTTSMLDSKWGKGRLELILEDFAKVDLKPYFPNFKVEGGGILLSFRMNFDCADGIKSNTIALAIPLDKNLNIYLHNFLNDPVSTHQKPSINSSFYKSGLGKYAFNIIKYICVELERDLMLNALKEAEAFYKSQDVYPRLSSYATQSYDKWKAFRTSDEDQRRPNFHYWNRIDYKPMFDYNTRE
ncbi:MAG: hypothetical protein OHK0017_07570 [Patescibacteria group bacterium]